MAKLPDATSTVTIDPPITSDATNGIVPVLPTPAATTSGKKLSPKNKVTRGVPSGWKTIYVPLDLAEADHERIHQVASVKSAAAQAAGGKSIKVGEMLAEVLKWGLQQYKEQFDTEAAKYVPSAGTKSLAKKIENASPEDAEKLAMSHLEKQQKALAKAQEILAQAKARQAAAAATTVPTA